MKKHISLRKLPSVLFMAVIFGTVFGFALGFNPIPFIGGLIGLAFIPAQFLPMGAFGMAIQKEIWESDIEEAIFPDSSFVTKSVDASQYVLAGKVVHIPQSGGAGTVVKNRSSLPAGIRKRSDTDITYALDEYTTDPVLIPNADNYELSYDKRNSVLGEDKQNLQLRVGNEMLYAWLNGLAAGSVLSTSGAAIAATAPGASGTRKAITLPDIQAARTKLAQQNRWFDGQMFLLIPSSLMPQLFPADQVLTATYMASVTEEERRRGIIAKVQGFNIMERSVSAIYSSAGVLSAPGAATAAGDCEGVVAWYSGSVERAIGTTESFEQLGDPTMYGDVYSFLARAGGRRKRSDDAGIVVIKQTFVS